MFVTSVMCLGEKMTRSKSISFTIFDTLEGEILPVFVVIVVAVNDSFMEKGSRAGWGWGVGEEGPHEDEGLYICSV